jgi:hypothetical protein
MKKVLFIMVLAASMLHVSAKTALVVIAHGAPSDEWNRPVLNIEKILNQVEIPGISYKRVALMEFSNPNINTVVKDCEKEGIDTIFALPLFIAPSSHSEDDIPNILGLKYDPVTRRVLAEEKAEIVKSHIRFIVGPTLMSSDMIEKTMLQRIKEMSKDTKNEAVLLLAHGDPERIGFWESILKKTGDYIKANTGIDYVDARLVGMGYTFSKDVNPILTKVAAEKKRILVQGIYLMSSVSDMAKMAKMNEKQKNIKSEIVYSEYGILPKSTPEICQWIVDTTKDWLKNK